MAYNDDLSEWWEWGHGGGELDSGAVGGEMGGVNCGLVNPGAMVTSGGVLSPYLSRGELAAENRRLYLDNMRLWDCLALFRTDPSLTCQGAINTIFTLNDMEYLREFPDTQQLLNSRFPSGPARQRDGLDATSENNRLREENTRLHAAVWVLRDNPTLHADSTVAAIFRLNDEQFKKKFGVVNQVTAGLCLRSNKERSSRNNNKVKVKAMRTHLDLGARTNTIHLIKKPIGPRHLSRAKSVSSNRQLSPLGETSITALALARKRSESAEPPQNFSSNWKSTSAEEVRDISHDQNYHGPLLSFQMPPPLAENFYKSDAIGKDLTRKTKSKTLKGVMSSRSDTNQTCSTNANGNKKHKSRRRTAKPIKCVSFEEPLPTTHDKSEEVFAGKPDIIKINTGSRCFKDRLDAILNAPTEHLSCINEENRADQVGSAGETVKRDERKKRDLSKKTRHRSSSQTYSLTNTRPTKTLNEIGERSGSNRRKGSVQRCDSWDDIRGSNSNPMGSRCPADQDFSDEHEEEDEEDGEHCKDSLHLPAHSRCGKYKRHRKFRRKYILREPSKRHKEEIRLSPVLDPRTSLHRLHISAGDGSVTDMEQFFITGTEKGNLPLDRNFNRTSDDIPVAINKIGKTWQKVSFSETPAVSFGEAKQKRFESSKTDAHGFISRTLSERGLPAEKLENKLPALQKPRFVTAKNKSFNKTKERAQIVNDRSRQPSNLLSNASSSKEDNMPLLEAQLQSNITHGTGFKSPESHKHVFKRATASEVCYLIEGSVVLDLSYTSLVGRETGYRAGFLQLQPFQDGVRYKGAIGSYDAKSGSQGKSLNDAGKILSKPSFIRSRVKTSRSVQGNKARSTLGTQSALKDIEKTNDIMFDSKNFRKNQIIPLDKNQGLDETEVKNQVIKLQEQSKNVSQTNKSPEFGKSLKIPPNLTNLSSGSDKSLTVYNTGHRLQKSQTIFDSQNFRKNQIIPLDKNKGLDETEMENQVINLQEQSKNVSQTNKSSEFGKSLKIPPNLANLSSGSDKSLTVFNRGHRLQKNQTIFDSQNFRKNQIIPLDKNQGLDETEVENQVIKLQEQSKNVSQTNKSPEFGKSLKIPPNLANLSSGSDKSLTVFNRGHRLQKSQTILPDGDLAKQSAVMASDDKSFVNRGLGGSRKVSSFMRSNNAAEDENKNSVKRAQIPESRLQEQQGTSNGLDRENINWSPDSENKMFVDHKKRSFRRSVGSVDSGVIRSSVCLPERVHLSLAAEITPYDTSRKRRPKSATGPREFTALRQANLKHPGEIIEKLEKSIAAARPNRAHQLGEEKRPKTFKRKSKSRAAGTEGKLDPVGASAIYYTASSCRHVLPRGTSYSYSKSSSMFPSGQSHTDEFMSQPIVYLSTEPAPDRASRYKPYPHRTYVTVKQFTDRHQRVMPQPTPVVRRLTSAMFSFSRERSPSMALVLDDDFQRWMANRVRSNSKYRYGHPQEHLTQRHKSHLYKHNLERWPCKMPPANSIYGVADKLKASQSTAKAAHVGGAIKDCNKVTSCMSNYETRLRMLKELGGVKYRGALATMIKHNIQAVKKKPRPPKLCTKTLRSLSQCLTDDTSKPAGSNL